MIFFFFQAEDGIRDLTVTGVQTCALPILLCQPNCCSKSASFRRPLPTSTAAAPIARTLTKVQSATNSSCITSTPCTSCTATPTTLQDDPTAWPAKGDEDTIATSRTDDPSRISTCRPV